MLAIRLQRTGRKGHAQFRMVVQDSRRTPTSGRFVYLLGSYDPHSKTAQIDKEKAALYLKNGARPSERVAMILKKEGVKLPDWVVTADKKKGTLRNPEKLRKNQPAVEAPVEEKVAEEAPVEEAPVAEPAVEETPAEEAPAVAEKVEAEKETEPKEEAPKEPAAQRK